MSLNDEKTLVYWRPGKVLLTGSSRLASWNIAICDKLTKGLEYTGHQSEYCGNWASQICVRKP